MDGAWPGSQAYLETPSSKPHTRQHYPDRRPSSRPSALPGRPSSELARGNSSPSVSGFQFASVSDRRVGLRSETLSPSAAAAASLNESRDTRSSRGVGGNTGNG